MKILNGARKIAALVLLGTAVGLLAVAGRAD